MVELVRRSPWIWYHDTGFDCQYCGEHFWIDLHSDDCAWADAVKCCGEIERGHMDDVELISECGLYTTLSELARALAKEYPWRWTSDRGNVCRYCGLNDETRPQKHAHGCAWAQARQATNALAERGTTGAEQDAG